ncbi:MAG TPA: dUTP diphosphatase [Bacilli bacterium]|nr:dUTP diphosphatase [Bacilli bacterium]
MSKMMLAELFAAQRKLDEEIAVNHGISYATTREKRTLALLVEVGELANATRCFKYWSNKNGESRERILDEYADGLHFFLSLGIDINSKKACYNLTKHKDNLSEQFLLIYQNISRFMKKSDDLSYQRAFQSFLNLIPLLGFRFSTIEKAYFKKLGENYQRQAHNY